MLHSPEADAAAAYEPLDAIGGVFGIVVLPDHQDRPSGGLKRVPGTQVAPDVRAELLDPPGAIRLRDRPVERAGMPKTASHLDHDTGTGEHDVVAGP